MDNDLFQGTTAASILNLVAIITYPSRILIDMIAQQFGFLTENTIMISPHHKINSVSLQSIGLGFLMLFWSDLLRSQNNVSVYKISAQQF